MLRGMVDILDLHCGVSVKATAMATLQQWFWRVAIWGMGVNEEAVHGIPSPRKLRQGDLVKLDVTIEKDGFMADAAVTLPVGTVSQEKQRLIACAEQAFRCATRVARAGNRVSDRPRDRIRSTAVRLLRDP